MKYICALSRQQSSLLARTIGPDLDSVLAISHMRLLAGGRQQTDCEGFVR